MVRLRVSLSDEEFAVIQKKADSYGLSASVYARDAIVRDASSQDQTTHHTESNILRSIRALIPTMVELDGRQRKNVTQAQIDEMTQTLLAHHAKACNKGEI
jgi:hypothetical protein